MELSRQLTEWRLSGGTDTDVYSGYLKLKSNVLIWQQLHSRVPLSGLTGTSLARVLPPLNSAE